MKTIKEISYVQKKQSLYLKMSIPVVLSIVFLLISIFIWKGNRGEAICTPKHQHSFPIIPYLPSVQSQDDTAKLYSFIERYVKNIYDEKIIDYHQPSNMNRYDNSLLKSPLLEAYNMSDGEARADIKKRYADSDDVLRKLRACNCGWIFNIMAIERIVQTQTNGVIYASVLGEYQVTYDKVKTPTPHELWGVKRVHLIIKQASPRKNERGEETNGYGLFVISHEMEDVSIRERTELYKQMSVKGFFVP